MRRYSFKIGGTSSVVRLMRRLPVLVMLLTLSVAHRATAQQPARASDSVSARAPTHLLRTRDGSTLLGRLVSESVDTVRFETSGGVLAYPRSQVAELKPIAAEDIRDGQYWAPDPHSSRLFFGPTGRTLKQGEKYLSDLYLFFVNGAIGVTDRLMIGGGMSLFPSSDLSYNVFFLTPKVALVQGDQFNLSAGAFLGFVGHVNGSAGFGYLAATSGGEHSSVTYGAGWAYVNNDVQSKPVLLLGGELRLSRRLALMSENYAYSGDASGAVVSLGLRIMGDKLSTDLAFWNYVGSTNSGIFPGIPWVGFAIKF